MPLIIAWSTNLIKNKKSLMALNHKALLFILLLNFNNNVGFEPTTPRTMDDMEYILENLSYAPNVDNLLWPLFFQSHY